MKNSSKFITWNSWWIFNCYCHWI